jgi:hypothetical protein
MKVISETRRVYSTLYIYVFITCGFFSPNNKSYGHVVLEEEFFFQVSANQKQELPMVVMIFPYHDGMRYCCRRPYIQVYLSCKVLVELARLFSEQIIEMRNVYGKTDNRRQKLTKPFGSAALKS